MDKCYFCNTKLDNTIRNNLFEDVDICSECMFKLSEYMSVIDITNELHLNMLLSDLKNQISDIDLLLSYKSIMDSIESPDEDKTNNDTPKTNIALNTEKALDLPKVFKRKKTNLKPDREYEILMKPMEIKKALDKYVIGQDETKKILSVAIYNHFKRIYDDKKDNIELTKSNILMIGPTGCGKTMLVQTLSKLFDVPMIIYDASSITATGYVGLDTSDILIQLYRMSEGDLERAQRGIVFVDEVDKIAKNTGTNKDVGGRSVQQSFLKMIESHTEELELTTYDHIMFDTTNVLFIFSGAFDGLNEIINKRMNTNSMSIGFGSQIVSKKDVDNNKLMKKYYARRYY
jgi:endopeptidase Clp ATP-binding regulatory subunit ClpX